MKTRAVNEEPAAPILRWAGGKSRLVAELAARTPLHYHRLFEPFAGGASLFFYLRPKRAVLNDANEGVMALYRQLAADPNGLIAWLKVHERLHRKDPSGHYYRMRDRWNLNEPPRRSPSLHDTSERAALFLYLNRTAFNGLWRVNRAGRFNVPMGNVKMPKICAVEELHACGAQLRAAELRCGDYRAAVLDARKGDLVYFDPPYVPASATSSFASYTPDRFGPGDHSTLALIAHRLVKRGCHVMLSNSDVPAVRALYQGWRIDRVMTQRSIASNPRRRTQVGEVIVCSPGCRRAERKRGVRRG